MKKIFSILAVAALSLGFTACEDVPAPYGVQDELPEVKPEDAVKKLPYSEAFSTTLGAFENYTVSGAGKWVIDHNTAKASGYNNADKTTTAGTYLLVSPEISLANQIEAHLAFEYILMYNKGFENQKVYISNSFDAAKPNEGWKELTLKMEVNSPGTWQDFKNADLQIPAEYMGGNIRIAFYYNTNDVSGSTWEIRNLTVAAGQSQGGGSQDKPEVQETVKQLPYGESFASEMGAFKNYTTSGAGAWTIDFKTAKASGYNNADKTTTAGTYYLVSPEISLENQKEAHFAFEYILRYNKGAENQKVLISKNFDEKNPTANWQEMTLTLTEGSDWKTFSKADLQVPAEYLGGKIRIAFYYNTNNVSGSTWEVRNFAIEAGKAGQSGQGEGGQGEGGQGNVGDPTTSNGGFETWVDGLPNNWKTASSAGNAKLSMSEVSRTGKYSVLVAGASSNKRMAYKEMELQPGTYTMSFFARAATADGGSVRPGYVVVVNGTIDGGNAYKYGDYVNNLSNTTWTPVTHTFELTEATTVSLIIMNAKKPGKDVLIDDFTLTDEKGTAIIK